MTCLSNEGSFNTPAPLFEIKRGKQKQFVKKNLFCSLARTSQVEPFQSMEAFSIFYLISYHVSYKKVFDVMVLFGFYFCFMLQFCALFNNYKQFPLTRPIVEFS